MTVRQVAEAAHVQPNTVYRWMTAGKLTKYKIEGRVLLDAAEVEAKIMPEPVGAEA
jgi:excisionase family DNA binding protein